jgi:hypothetical protein
MPRPRKPSPLRAVEAQRRQKERKKKMPNVAVLAGWTVQCLNTISCGNKYEAYPPRGETPLKPRCCSMCKGRVDATPFYGEALK